MRVFGDHAKTAITWQFGHSLSRFLRHNLSQSLVFKCILIRGNATSARTLLGLSNEGFFWAIFETFSLVAPFHFFLENAGFK